MRACVRVVAPGAYASIQDAGRIGFRRIGVPWSGVLDRRLMRIANQLAGNEETAPVIECFDGGQQFAVAGASLRIAVAGNAVLEVEDDAGRRQIAPWRSFILESGHTLRIARISPGRIAVLAVSRDGSASNNIKAHDYVWFFVFTGLPTIKTTID